MAWASFGLLVLLLAASLHPDIPSDAGSGIDAPNACEPGTATIHLEPNVEYLGFFDAVNDSADNYGFFAPEPGTYQVNMKPLPAVSVALPTPNYDLRLYDGGCAFIDQSVNEGTRMEEIKHDLLPGLYHVEVVPHPILGVKASATLLNCHPYCVPVGYNLTIHPPQL